MEYDSALIDKLLTNYNLLCSVVEPSNSAPPMQVDLAKLETIITKKIPDALKKNAPDDFYELFVDFKAEYERFRDFILYDRLIGKNIVALGGGFSSGKSSFLNALMGKSVLPADIDPSTSVPTYIVQGAKHEVVGLNVFDAKVPLQPRDLRKIAHGFGELETDDDKKITKSVTLGHVLETVFFSTPLHQFTNIAFLDTPGYSKPDSEKYSAKTDEQIARGQLNSSNYILWFVQADAGTITAEDLKFILSLRSGIPLLVIVNKADKKTQADLIEIIAKIKHNLSIKGVPYLDVLAFSDRLDQIDDSGLRSFIAADTNKIQRQLDAWNCQVYEANFARNFKKIFVRCRDYYDSEIANESRQLSQLNTSLTFLDGEDIDADVLKPLILLMKQTRRNVNMLKDIKSKLTEIQNEFFTEIKAVADVVGIAMPEPSEIDLLQENAPNLWQLLDNYRKHHGICTDRATVKQLHEIFADVESCLDKYSGQSKPHKEQIQPADFKQIAAQASKPLVRDFLDRADEAIKMAFFGSLAFTAALDNRDYSNQLFYLCRLARGCKYRVSAGDLHKMWLKYSAADIERLEQTLDEFKYAFLIEALVLTNLPGPASSDMLGVLADLASILEITPEELRVLGLVARGILQGKDIESIFQEIAAIPEFADQDVQAMFVADILPIYVR